MAIVAVVIVSGGGDVGPTASTGGAPRGETAIGPTAASGGAPTGGTAVAPTAPTGTTGPTIDAARPATEDLPYTFSYPSSWNTTYSDSFSEVLSPVPIDWTALSDIDWTELPELDLSQLVGVFDRGFYGLDLAEFFGPEFPISDPITVSSPTETTVDGFPALRMEGSIYESSLGGAQLPALVYVVQVREGVGVYLVFFGSDQAFDPALFDRIVGTLRFDPALLEAQFADATPSF